MVDPPRGGGISPVTEPGRSGLVANGGIGRARSGAGSTSVGLESARRSCRFNEANPGPRDDDSTGRANPYLIPALSPWFTVINVSGGRSSAFMLRQVLDAHGGELPPRCEAVFANTGKERRETLDFVQALTEPASCIKFLPIHAFTARNTGFSGRSSVRLKFTASEDKPHAIFLNLVQGRTQSFVKRM